MTRTSWIAALAVIAASPAAGATHPRCDVPSGGHLSAENSHALVYRVEPDEQEYRWVACLKGSGTRVRLVGDEGAISPPYLTELSLVGRFLGYIRATGDQYGGTREHVFLLDLRTGDRVVLGLEITSGYNTGQPKLNGIRHIKVDGDGDAAWSGFHSTSLLTASRRDFVKVRHLSRTRTLAEGPFRSIHHLRLDRGAVHWTAGNVARSAPLSGG
jgi:hypothetical protein